MTKRNLIADVLRLKSEKNALILAHNYQIPEIHAVADIVGDSLELALAARKATEPVLVLCGVRFMAETAHILNPEKKVLLPDSDAGCPLADFLTPGMILEAKEKYPEAAVVVYINSTAECKAVSDSVCTSGNAVRIVKSLKQRQVIFGPDTNLASYVQSVLPEKEIIPIPEGGHCYVHMQFDTEDLKEVKTAGISIMVHPECPANIRVHADHVISTGKMAEIAKTGSAWYICTEVGMLDRLKELCPDQSFIGLEDAICADMKKTSLQELITCLRDLTGEVIVPPEIMEKARRALEYMISVP
ncbi:quinolinate synthase NadA [Methanospirillum sp.]|uniref:quinolinate synthase NadA n=1 Tax=Methanospirillum sp. TaxID=45200 RepID=UPI002983DAA2|nr:quinolinate synthase NadA [Methanospirillum sp.]